MREVGDQFDPARDPNAEDLKGASSQKLGIAEGWPAFAAIREALLEQYGVRQNVQDAREAVRDLPAEQRTRVEEDLDAVVSALEKIDGKLDDATDERDAANRSAAKYFWIGMGGAAVGVIVGLAGIAVSVGLALWL